MPTTRRARGARSPSKPTETRENLWSGLEWRSAGPHRGGRVVAVAGDPARAGVFYFGSTGGGVWKTGDGGVYWENVSDGFFKRASVGAIAVAGSDPNVIYVGMGEATIRGNVSHGDGVYRSTDAGKTWSHLGLADTRNIGKVRVHPRDPDTVYVAALGHAHGPNAERGLYRSRDGGRTWTQVLSRGDRAGAIDVALDPQNPRTLYATFWETVRGPWSLTSGGPGSGLLKSTDGGDTWTELSRARGLPRGVLGKIGVAVSPARADRVWAIVEAADGAVFRSDDGGESWERLSEDRNLRQRAWYYHHIYADPRDPETVWVLNVDAWRSSDAGKTFIQMSIPHGDHHDLWIDPHDPQRMIEGNDGGATVTFNGGESWTSVYNQPTAEYYHVTVDTQVPYRIYAAQQDNTTMSVPSRAPIAGITGADAFAVGGGESGYIAVRPDDPNVIFAGNYQGLLTRHDRRSGQSRNIMVWPEVSAGLGAGEVKYRFQWTYPILLSPHDPNVLYVTGNHVFRSRDEGTTWEVLSPDLTRNDASKLGPSGGPITKDNTGAEYYCTIFAFAESPQEPGVFWAGSDDGLVHVSRDDGRTWTDVTPRGIAPWTLISIIEPSPHDPATAYIAATRYKLDDFHPYLFGTDDYGSTWRQITAGLPDDDFTRVIREDPVRRGLLYAGTETGVYASFDDGQHWQRLGGNLPVVPIHDMVVKDDDLVLATHGRAFWVLDDLGPLRQQSAAIARKAAHLYQPGVTTRFRTDFGFPQPPKIGKNYRMTGATVVTYRQVEKPSTGEKVPFNLDAGQNPPDGVVVQYALRERPAGEVKLAFLDGRGRQIRSFTSKRDDEPAGSAPEQAMTGEGAEPIETASQPTKPATADTKEPRVPKERGLNRFVWNMRYPDAAKLEGEGGTWEGFERQLAGPAAVPGTYRVRLTADGVDETVPFEIRKDPRVAATQRDFEDQFGLLMRIRDKVSETHEGINEIRRVSAQLDGWEARAKSDPSLRRVARAAGKLRKKLVAIEEELVQTKAKSRQDTLNFPIKLNAKLAGLGGAVSSADFAPTRSSYELFDDLSSQVDRQLAKLDQLNTTDAKAFNALVRSARVVALDLKPYRASRRRRPVRRAARRTIRSRT